MNWESWIVTAAVVLCMVALTTCEPSEKHCNVVHENAPSLKKCEIW